MSTRPVLPPFWSLVDAHGGELLAHARRLAGPEDAEDVLQDAMLRALRAYPRLKHADHLRAWLYRVTTTAAYDAMRRRRRVRAAETPHGELPELAAADDHSTAPDAALEDGFDELIAGLPDPTRDTLRLRFVEDLEYTAIAERLGCSPEAARQRVSAAIRSLRKELCAA